MKDEREGDVEMSSIIREIREDKLREAKEKLLEYYKKHEGTSIYPDEAAHELGLDLKVAMEAVEELVEEGKLEEG